MMWKEIFIFSIGVAVGIVVGFAINGFEIDINVNHNINLPTGIVIRSDAASGWAGWALAHPEFGISVNPITTRGADYAHHITASSPGFENPLASLMIGGATPTNQANQSIIEE